MLEDLIASYRSANKRLLLLDYDGTLTDFKPTPQEARPDKDVLSILQHLSADPHNTIVIISGRDKATLDAWLGHLPVTLAAEHGYVTRRPGHGWIIFSNANMRWKKLVLQEMAQSTKAVPGSFVEKKESAVVWHYRTADAAAAETETDRLLKRLKPIARAHGVIAQAGNKIVEARLASVTKDTVGSGFVAEEPWDFILAAGDDTTDEDLFAAMPSSAFTIKVRPGDTKATSRVADHAALLELLRSLQ